MENNNQSYTLNNLLGELAEMTKQKQQAPTQQEVKIKFIKENPELLQQIIDALKVGVSKGTIAELLNQIDNQPLKFTVRDITSALNGVKGFTVKKRKVKPKNN